MFAAMPLSPTLRARACAITIPLLLIVACSGKEPAPQAQAIPRPSAEQTQATPAAPVVPSAPDPCAMISAAELQAATSIAAESHSSMSGGARVCTWTDANGKSAIVQLYPTASGYEESRRAFESFYKATAETVAGLGDEACYIAGKTASMPTATFCVLKGSSSASVQVMSITEDLTALKPQALALAQKLAAKL